MSLTAGQGAKKLAELFLERSCVVFFGAGVSMNAGLPSGSQLAKLLGLPSLDLTRASFVAQQRGRAPLHALMKALTVNRPHEQHRFLALLQAPYYITTNYDQLFEYANEDLYEDTRPEVYTRSSTDVELNPSRNVPVYIKLHGDIADLGKTYEEGGPIFTHAEYALLLRHPLLVDHWACVILASYNVLFIGCSLQDINVIDALASCSQKWNPNPKERFIVLFKATRDEKQFLSSIGVEPITLGGKDHAQYGENVTQFLGNIWTRVEEAKHHLRSLDAKPNTSEGRLDRGWTCYRCAEFQEAKKWIENVIKQDVRKLFRNMNLLLQIVHFYPKVLDKLEEWDTGPNHLLALVEKAFKDSKRVLPKSVHNYHKKRFHQTRAITCLRSVNLPKAIKSMRIANALDSVDRSSEEVRLHYADRMSVEAQCHLASAVWGGKRIDRKASLKEAIECLADAYRVFKIYGRIGTNQESHYLGRFHGTRAFVEVARIQASTKPDPNRFHKVLQDARAAHGGKRAKVRMPYGKLAGLYCEAYCRYCKGLVLEKRDEQKKAMREFEQALDRIDRIDKIKAQRGCLVEYKIAVLQGRITTHLSAINEASRFLMPGVEDRIEIAHRKLKTKNKAVAARIKRIVEDNWIRTPII